MTVKVRGLMGEIDVRAVIVGDWAVHRQVDSPDLWGITLIHTGMSLPFAWASFRSQRDAASLARHLMRMRNSWAVIDQDELARDGPRIRKACARRGAVEGPVQLRMRIGDSCLA